MRRVHLALCFALIVAAAMVLAVRTSSAQTPIDFVQGISRGYFTYTLSGTGNSRTMNLRVTNVTEQVWELDIHDGTKLEPADGGVQNMVVTREIHITLHPHEEQRIKVDVDCLDISLDPPSPSNTRWRVRSSPALASFISCVTNSVDTVKRNDPNNAKRYEMMRSYMLQLGLWNARGASRQQMIDFWVHYQSMPRSEAQRTVDGLNPLLQALTTDCGSLTNT
jgi:hypothetical protein